MQQPVRQYSPVGHGDVGLQAVMPAGQELGGGGGVLSGGNAPSGPASGVG